MPSDQEKLALFRTYRPQDFGDLVGQDHVQKTILNALRAGRAAHAYLFSGPRGTGKTTTARLVAKGLLCPELLDNPDAPSDAWRDILAGRHLDCIEIDAASNRGIDEIRDLREKVRFSPTKGAKKVFIIDEVHMLTAEAFNALLKTLEEPPAHAHFVLATTELHKVPATIVSRCQHFEFRRIPETQIVQRIQDVLAREQALAAETGAPAIDMEPEAFPLIAHAAQGALRDALVLLEQATTPGHRTTRAEVQEMLGLVHADAVRDFLVALLAGDAARCLGLIHDLYGHGADLIAFGRDCIQALRDRMVENIRKRAFDAVPFELAAIRAIEQALLDAKVAATPELPLELAVIELLQPKSAVRATPIHHAAEPPRTSPAPAAPSPTPSQNDSRAGAPGSVSASAPEIVEDPAPDPVPAPVVSPASEESSDARPDLATSWGAILAALKHPSVRLAAKKAQIVELDAHAVALRIGPKFEFEKLANDAAKHDIEHAILTVTGRKVRVQPEHVPSARPAVSGAGESPPQAVDDVFGGEILS